MNRRSLFLIYLVECIIGVTIGSYCFHKNAEVGGWVLVSTIMVLAPDKDEAIKFAFNRIKANLVGAAVGLILTYIHSPNVYMITSGVVLAALGCELLNIRSAMRSATVGIVLISLTPPGKNFYDVACARVLGVIAGCTVAMLLTVVIHTLVRKSGYPVKFRKAHILND